MIVCHCFPEPGDERAGTGCGGCGMLNTNNQTGQADPRELDRATLENRCLNLEELTRVLAQRCRNAEQRMLEMKREMEFMRENELVGTRVLGKILNLISEEWD